MQLNVFDILNFVIFITGAVGCARWRQVQRAFHPFFILIWVGCINEMVNYALVWNGFQTVINNNIYFIIEALILVWYFKNVGLFKRNKFVLFSLAALFAAMWLAEVLVNGTLQKLVVYFRIFYSLTVVLMSVSVINRLALSFSNSLLKNPVFLIAIGFILYFTMNVLVNAFWFWGLTKSNKFLLHIYFIMLIVNCLSNLIYLFAIVMMPRQKWPLSLIKM